LEFEYLEHSNKP